MEPQSQSRKRLSKIVSQEGSDIVCVESMRRADENTQYKIPITLQDIENHVNLLKVSAVKNAARTLKKRDHYRNVRVNLREPLIQEYLDEDGNFIFREYYLKEMQESDSTRSFSRAVEETADIPENVLLEYIEPERRISGSQTQ